MRPSSWTLAAALGAAPVCLLLVLALWRSPYPLSESVGLLEDVAERPASSFLLPSSSYYRPAFHLSLSAIWNHAESADTALAAIKLLLHILPLTALVAIYLACARPRSAIEAAAALVGMAVLIGSPGTLGNLELPLSYTIVGMPAALLAWLLLERPRRPWTEPAVFALLLLAVGFKEQGLVLVPVIVVAWWFDAPGARRSAALIASAFAIAYVVFRFTLRSEPFPTFEQSVGYGFEVLSPAEAEARFPSPLRLYVYNSVATVLNVLIAEPTEGVFRSVQAWRAGTLQPWQIGNLVSSCGLTALVAWWGGRAMLRDRRHGWGTESRLMATFVVALAACGVLSFNYSRERLAGMAVPFLALSAYYAVRAAALSLARLPRVVSVAGVALLLVLATGWQLRAIYTLEFTRQRAVNAHREWLTDSAPRRVRYGGRPTYLAIMQAMTPQGTAPPRVSPTRYPRWFMQVVGED